MKLKFRAGYCFAQSSSIKEYALCVKHHEASKSFKNGYKLNPLKIDTISMTDVRIYLSCKDIKLSFIQVVGILCSSLCLSFF